MKNEMKSFVTASSAGLGVAVGLIPGFFAGAIPYMPAKIFIAAATTVGLTTIHYKAFRCIGAPKFVALKYAAISGCSAAAGTMAAGLILDLK